MNGEPCMCGADDCPRCYPEIGEEQRRQREEWQADNEDQIREDREFWRSARIAEMGWGGKPD